MSCCGKARAEAVARMQAAREKPPVRQTIEFEYTGHTALNVVGPVSRSPYRFGRPGARVTVDARDSAALARLPALRRLR